MKEGKYRLEFGVGKYVLMPVDAFTLPRTSNFKLFFYTIFSFDLSTHARQLAIFLYFILRLPRSFCVSFISIAFSTLFAKALLASVNVTFSSLCFIEMSRARPCNENLPLFVVEVRMKVEENQKLICFLPYQG